MLVQVSDRMDGVGWAFGTVMYTQPSGGVGDGGEIGALSSEARELSRELSSDLGEDDAEVVIDEEETSGWFPVDHIRNPTAQELKLMSDALGGKDAALEALSPPPYWEAARAKSPQSG